MSSLLFSESKSGRLNPLRELSHSLNGASSSRDVVHSDIDDLRRLNPNQLDRLDPREELEMSEVWNKVNLEKGNLRKLKPNQLDQLDPWKELEMSEVWNKVNLERRKIPIVDEIKLEPHQKEDVDFLFDNIINNYKVLSYEDFLTLSSGRQNESSMRAANAFHFVDNMKRYIFWQDKFDYGYEKFHTNLRENMINLIEDIRRGENFTLNFLHYKDLKKLLNGEHISFNSKNNIELISMYYAYHYLGMEKMIDWGNIIEGYNEIKDLLNYTANQKIKLEKPLENYLREKGDLFNYVEIIEELKKGRILPGARHAIVLSYYINQRKGCIRIKTNEDIILKKILTSNPIEIFKQLYKDDKPEIPKYSDARKWSKFFTETHRYVVKNPSSIDLLTETLKNVTCYFFPADFKLEEEINRWNLYLLKNTSNKEKVENYLSRLKMVFDYNEVKISPSIKSKL